MSDQSRTDTIRVVALSGRRFSRRAALRLAGTAALGLTGLMAACSPNPTPSPAAQAPAAAPPAAPAASPAAPAPAAAAPASSPAAVAPAAPAAAPAAPAAAKPPKTGGTLKWGIEASVESLDPIWTTATVTARLAYHLWSSLYAYDESVVLQPMLAEKHEVSADGLLYTFTLRPGLLFEDNGPLTTDDVIASLNRWGKKATAGVELYKRVDTIEAKSPTVFTIKLKEPFSLVLDTLAGLCPIMPKAVAQTPGDERIEKIISSGPYRLVEWQKGNRIVLEPNKNFKTAPGKTSNFAGLQGVWVDRVEVLELPDQASRLAALEAGTIDLMTSPSSDFYGQIKDNPIFQVTVIQPGSLPVLMFNHTREPFKHLKARQAVQAGANMEEYLQASIGPKELWQLCPGVLLCGTPAESSVGADLYNQKNLPKAQQLFKELVAEGGYSGQPVVLVGNTSYTEHYNAALVTKELLEKIGFTVDLQTPDWATAIARRAQKDGWDLFHTGHGGVTSNDPIRSLILSSGWFGWPQIDGLDDAKAEYARAITPEAKKVAIDKVQRIYADQIPHLNLGQALGFHASRKWLKDLSVNPNVALTNVWLDK